MEVKPGYKQTEVGVIPEDWTLDCVENVAHITTGGRNTQDRIQDGKYPFFVRSQKVERINSYSFDGEAVLTAGDGVGTGKVFHYITGKFDVHQRVYRIADFSERLNGFYFYLYFSTHFYNRIMQMTAKSSVDSVRREMIAQMLVPLPPTVAEQNAIAAALSDVDGLLGGLDRLIAKKRDLKQAAMQQLLTGQTRLPGFHGRWEVKPLSSDIADLEAGISVNSVDEELGAGSGGAAVLKTSSVAGGKFIPSACKAIAPRDLGRVKLSPRAESVIISRMNTIELVGECGYIPIDFPTLFIPDRLWMTRFRSRSQVSARWLAIMLSTAASRLLIRNIATGTSGSMKNISKGAFLALELKFPQPDEQAAIAEVLTDMDAEIGALEQRRAKTHALKQAMMQELLTGKTRLV